jgi:tetratricopeptide (TPR) repeat protein
MAVDDFRRIILRLCSKLTFTRDNGFGNKVDVFDEFFDLHGKGSYREAYAVLRDIMESQPRLSKIGDLHVLCAQLELMVNDDVRKAGEILDRAHELGCRYMAFYYKERGYVLWRSGDHGKGIEYLEKSVELEPTVAKLSTLGKLLSSDHDKRSIWVWQRLR